VYLPPEHQSGAFVTEKPSDIVQGLGYADPKNTGSGTDAWIWNHCPAGTDEQRHLSCQCGLAVCCSQRLQRAGLIRSEWKATENSRRAKYYILTQQGRKRLDSETREWGRQVAAIARILEAS
jgi:DNA-binding MarR family transcriptional regulator